VLEWPSRLSLAGQFFLASLAVLVAGMVLTGAWIGQVVERGVLTRNAGLSALYVESVLGDHLATLASEPRLSEAEVATLDRLLAESPLGQRIKGFKVWSADGEVLYSPDRRVMGQRFAVHRRLGQALQGEVSAELSDLSEPENTYERERPRLFEVYTPVREHDAWGRVLAVVEFYQAPDDVEREVTAARLESWAVVGAVTCAIYFLLAGLVKRGSDTIDRHLSELATLHDRLRRAGARTTRLNEQALRRVSADLHDGPGQVLALALLRLDQLYPAPEGVQKADSRGRDIEVIRGALQQALTELRAIAAGLRLPELESGDLSRLVRRTVGDHERRTGVPVRLSIGQLPEMIPVASKIALLRSLQEGLSNASRHGLGRDVEVRICSARSALKMAVSDGGPGFVIAQASAEGGGLGLAGMRERAELLGGHFSVESEPGRGTTIHLVWPLHIHDSHLHHG
jgi:signal transduction histidine kinase